MILNEPYKLKKRNKTLPLIVDLYFLDDGSLIIDKTTTLSNSITLVPTDKFKIVKTTGSHYLSQLSEKEAYDFLIGQSLSRDKNGLSSGTKREESVDTGVKKIE